MTGRADPDAVEAMYRYIDDEAFDALFDLVAPEITYTRSGPRVIDGKDAFEQLYREDRNLDGTHTIDELVAEGDTVAVKGRFEGTKLTDGSPADFGFADFVRFDDEGLIVERATFNNMLDEPL